jgi:hypothetical protein
MMWDQYYFNFDEAAILVEEEDAKEESHESGDEDWDLED